MAKYESGDIVTYYFIIKENNRNTNNIIHAWSDNKKLVKFYLDFHKCKNFIMKTVTKTIDDISKVLDENVHDEIKIYNIVVKDHSKNKPGKVKIISIPATETEFRFVDEECNTCVASRINYGFLNGSIPYLKNKYQDAIDGIFLKDIMNYVIHNRSSRIVSSIQFDNLMILLRSFPDTFGE